MGAPGAHQQADAALVVRAGLGDVAVPPRVAPPRVLVRVRIAAVLPRVRRLDGAGLDLRAARAGPSGTQHRGVRLCPCVLRRGTGPCWCSILRACMHLALRAPGRVICYLTGWQGIPRPVPLTEGVRVQVGSHHGVASNGTALGRFALGALLSHKAALYHIGRTP